ncbi:MAG: hypothetical protein E7580_00010 [Ruminococcaceae bacterium]|nr:hypothetical protein [Oscillospiraceae bacterium]
MKKEIDNLGRIVIPKFIREDMQLSKDPFLSIEYDSDQKQIVLKKAVHTCAVCGTRDGLLQCENLYLCKKCLQSFDKA